MHKADQTQTAGRTLPAAHVRHIAQVSCVLAAALIAGGCASNQLAVTYDSNPRGASLVCNGMPKGYTPITLNYEMKTLKGKTQLNNNCMALWASNYRRMYDPIPLQQSQKAVSVIVSRPDGPGLEKDTERAREVERSRTQQMQQQQQMQRPQGQPPALPALPSLDKIVTCTRFGDLSGQVYQFKNFCPTGYFQSN